MPTWAAVLASSVGFGVAHLSARDLPVLSALGVLLGFSYVRSRNLLTPIIIHGAWNSGVLTLLFWLTSEGVDVTSMLQVGGEGEGEGGARSVWVRHTVQIVPVLCNAGGGMGISCPSGGVSPQGYTREVGGWSPQQPASCRAMLMPLLRHQAQSRATEAGCGAGRAAAAR